MFAIEYAGTIGGIQGIRGIRTLYLIDSYSAINKNRKRSTPTREQ
jgi:hypothetical protein